MNIEQIKINYKEVEYTISVKFRDINETAIFFIHGLGCTKDTFNHIWKIKDFNQFSLLTFDLIGFGKSSKPKNFSYSMEEQAEICYKIILKFSFKKIHIVAHSMGGAIALLLAEKIPGKIISFINVEGNLYRSDCGISKEVAVSSYNNFRKRLFTTLKLKLNSSDEKGMKHWAQCSAEADPDAFYKSSKSLVQWTCSGKLLHMYKSLKFKKLYIYGEMNSWMPVLTKISNMEKISISNSGHFPMIDNEKEFYEKLIQLIL